MEFIKNDGGRSDTDFKGTAGDCVVRAIAIASDVPYMKVYEDLNECNSVYAKSRRNKIAKNLKKHGSTSRDGNFKAVYHSYILSLGFKWTPTMKIGQGCHVHMRSNELPNGRIIARLSRHLSAVIDGTINDTYDTSRNETRCVYGYYSRL